MTDPSPTVMQSDMFLIIDPEPDCLSIAPDGEELLRLLPDGTVIAADAVTATEAGEYFVKALVKHWPLSVAAVRIAAEQAGYERAERDIVAFLRGETVTDYTDPQYDLGINLADAIEALAHRKDEA
jgi:hypothetical protein